MRPPERRRRSPRRIGRQLPLSPLPAVRIAAARRRQAHAMSLRHRRIATPCAPLSDGRANHERTAALTDEGRP